MNGSLLLAHVCNIGPSFNTMFNDGWINPKNLGIGPSKNITELLKKCFVGSHFFREQDAPSVIYSTTSGLVDMLTLIFGEMLAILPSSKASGVEMGFLNQSTFPWMNSLASTEY